MLSSIHCFDIPIDLLSRVLYQFEIIISDLWTDLKNDNQTLNHCRNGIPIDIYWSKSLCCPRFSKDLSKLFINLLINLSYSKSSSFYDKSL